MKRVAIIFAVLLMTFFVVSCNNQKVPTGVPQSDPVVPIGLAKGGPPANSGIVIRIETNGGGWIGWMFEDRERKLVSLNVTGNGFYCQPSTAFELLDFHLAFTPTSAVRSLIKGETFVRVYGPATFDDITDFCNFIKNGPILAEGTANWVYHDNNFYLTGPGINAMGMESNGKLQLVGSGGMANYHLNFKALANPDGSIRELVQDINLNY